MESCRETIETSIFDKMPFIIIFMIIFRMVIKRGNRIIDTINFLFPWNITNKYIYKYREITINESIKC